MNINNIELNSIANTAKYNSNDRNSDNAIHLNNKGHKHESGEDDVMKVVNNLNNTINQFNKKVSFSYHEKTHRVVFKVINTDTNEVIREVPPKEMVKLLENIQEYLGVFVDEQR